MEDGEGEKMNVNGFYEWPKEIIQHIQSFLARRDAANTGLLSKSWYHAWSTRPILDFSDVLPCFNSKSDNAWTIWQSVRRTMKRYKQSNLKLEKLVLTIGSGYRHPSSPVFTRFVDELFEDASTLGVSELHSTQEIGFGDQRCTVFPINLAFAIRSLTKLFVRSGKVRGPIEVQCPFLVSLCLHSVSIRTEDIQDIILGCPLIENLDVQCYSVTYIDVSNLHNLVVLNVCDKRNSNKYIEVSFDSLTNGGINEFHRLRDVRLTGVEIDDTFFQNLSSRFPCIEELALVHYIGYEDIHISSKTLKSLTLRLKGKKVEKAEFDVPNIRRFEFQSRDIPALSFMTVSTEWESHVKLSCLYENLGVSNWFVRLKEFLEELSLSKLYLHLKVDQSLPIWAKNLSHSPPVVVEHLVLNYHPQGEALLCALFGFCQPEAIKIYKFERDTEAYSFAEALHWLFQHQNSFSRIHELLEIDVEIFQESEWQNIPLQHFVEDFPKFPFEKYICFWLKWGPFKCT